MSVKCEVKEGKRAVSVRRSHLPQRNFRIERTTATKLQPQANPTHLTHTLTHGYTGRVHTGRCTNKHQNPLVARERDSVVLQQSHLHYTRGEEREKKFVGEDFSSTNCGGVVAVQFSKFQNST